MVYETLASPLFSWQFWYYPALVQLLKHTKNREEEIDDLTSRHTKSELAADWREREREEMKRKPTWRLWSLMYDQIRFMVSGRDISVTPRNFFRAGDTADTRVSALVAAFAADEPAAAGILLLVLLFSSLLSVCLCLCVNSSPISAEKWLARTRKKNAFPVLQAPPKPNFFPEATLSLYSNKRGVCTIQETTQQTSNSKATHNTKCSELKITEKRSGSLADAILKIMHRWCSDDVANLANFIAREHDR